jgi:uncharacterized protein with gpF-like domain
VDTTAQRVKRTVQNGILDGKSLDDIAKEMYDPNNPAFSNKRSQMIARTESTNAISGAQLKSYNQAETDFGLTVKKIWVANRDKKTRPDHLDLESKYGRDDQAIGSNESFKIGDFEAQGPGLFGVASQDINCRCALVPIVE